MKIITNVYVGVDVSKNKLDAHFHPTGTTNSFMNSEDGIKKLIGSLLDYDVIQIVCEATGGYEDLMVQMLHSAGHKIWRVEPNRIKSFIRSKGKKAKTDTIDARMIALFSAQETSEHKFIEHGEVHTKLKDLTKRRKDLIEMISMERQRLKHPNHLFSKVAIQEHIDFMGNQVKELDHKIDTLIENNSNISKKTKIIESVPGIGRTTAAIIVAEMPELGEIKNKQAAALVGVAPYTQESGQYKGKSAISGGRKTVRCALFMAALVASRFNPIMKEFYHRLCVVGKKSPKVALVAVMRKLVVILNTMIRNETMWSYT